MLDLVTAGGGKKQKTTALKRVRTRDLGPTLHNKYTTTNAQDLLESGLPVCHLRANRSDCTPSPISRSLLLFRKMRARRDAVREERT